MNKKLKSKELRKRLGLGTVLFAAMILIEIGSHGVNAFGVSVDSTQIEPQNISSNDEFANSTNTLSAESKENSFLSEEDITVSTEKNNIISNSTETSPNSETSSILSELENSQTPPSNLNTLSTQSDLNTEPATVSKVRKRRGVVGSVLKVGESTSVEEMKAAMGNSAIEAIQFIVDRSFTLDGFLLNRSLNIIVDDGVNVDFTAATVGSGNAFKASLGDSNYLKIDNKGTLNFNNFYRAFWVLGGDNSVFSITGDGRDDSGININDNQGYAIAAMDNFSGTVNIEDTSINTNSTRTNMESAVYLGNQYNARVNILDSDLNLVNNSDHKTSSVFTSNANEINIDNSNISSSSRSHYNFNTHAESNTALQNVNIKNGSNITLITPDDANPNKDRSLWGFTIPIPESAVGFNSKNTHFNVTGNSNIDHQVGSGFTGKHTGLEINKGTKFIVENSTASFRSVGFDNDGDDSKESTIEISNGSKVDIDSFNSYSNIPLSKIQIDGGSVLLPSTLPTLPSGEPVPVVNSNGEKLTHFSITKENFEGESIPSGTNNRGIVITPNTENLTDNPDYVYPVNMSNIHGNKVNVWTPAVDTRFYPSKEDADASAVDVDRTGTHNIIDQPILVPRGSSIRIVGATTPSVDSEGSFINLANGEKFDSTNKILSNTILYFDKSPDLELENKTINKGENINASSVIKSAIDREDGDLTGTTSVLVNDGGLDVNTPGTYTITVKVTDSKGNTRTKTATITVVNTSSNSSTYIPTTPGINVSVPNTGTNTSTPVEPGTSTSGSGNTTTTTGETTVTGTEGNETLTSGNNVTNAGHVTTTVNSDSKKINNNVNTKSALPKTGDSSLLGLISLAGASLFTVILGRKNKKR